MEVAMFRRGCGCVLALAGVILAFLTLFIAFNGKYGINQFITDLTSLQGNLGMAAFSLVWLGMAVVGLLLFFVGKKKA
jgi:hypothetical protein